MQRLSLHFRGIEVPALGSPRDKIFRDYLGWEARKEAKKHELLMLLAMASPNIANENRRTWNTGVKKSFEAYVSLLWGAEPNETSEEDDKMVEFYEEVVKKSTVVMTKTKEGLVATGVPGVVPNKTPASQNHIAPRPPTDKRVKT